MKSSVTMNQPVHFDNISLTFNRYKNILVVDKNKNNIFEIPYEQLKLYVNKNLIFNNSKLNKSVIKNIRHSKKGLLDLHIVNNISDNIYEGFFIEKNFNNQTIIMNGTVFYVDNTKITVMNTMNNYKFLEIENINNNLSIYLPKYFNKFEYKIANSLLKPNDVFIHGDSTYPDFDKLQYEYQQLDNYININKYYVYNYSNIFKRTMLKNTDDIELLKYGISYYSIDNADELNKLKNYTIVGIDTLLVLETNYSQLNQFFNYKDIIIEKYSNYKLTNKQLLTIIPINEYDKYILNSFMTKELTTKVYDYIYKNNINIGIFGQLMLII